MPDTLTDEQVGLGPDQVFSDADVGLYGPEEALPFSLRAAQTATVLGTGMLRTGMQSQARMRQQEEEEWQKRRSAAYIPQFTDLGIPLGTESEEMQRGFREGAVEPLFHLPRPSGTDPRWIAALTAALGQAPTPELSGELAGAAGAAEGAVETSLGTPVGLATAGMGVGPGGAISRPLLGAAWGGYMASQVPQSAREAGRLSVEGTPREQTEAYLNLGGNVILPGFIGANVIPRTKGLIDASRIQEATAVHGDLRAQPGQGPGQVPTEVSGAGVQPPPEEVAKTAQVSLTPVDPYNALEREAIDHAERLGGNADVVEATTDPQTPFARRIAWVGSDGRIKINRGEFREWLSWVPEERRSAAIESLIGEEHIHSKVTDEMAKSYWNNLTGLEKWLVRRRYLGKDISPLERAKFDDTALGHEAIRGRIQQLTRATPREIAEAVGREKWTVKIIYALERAIASVRKALGTKASWAQKAILERVQQNLELAKGVVAPSSGPSAFRKRSDEELSDSVKMFRDQLPQEKTGVGGGTNRAHAAGLGARTVADLDALAQMRLDSHMRGKGIKDLNEKMVEMMRGQYAREAIETATDTGSNAEVEWAGRGAPLGPRPLDWRNNPDVANWLREHGPAIGIALPDALRESEYMGYLTEEERKGPTAAFGKRRGPKPGPGKEGKAGEQPELFGEPITAKGVPGAETVPRGTRGSAQELGAAQGVTTQDVLPIIQQHLEEQERPSFKGMLDWFQRNAGRLGITAAQVRPIWEDTLWSHLMNAKPERLEQLRKELKLESRLGKRPIQQVEMPTAEQAVEGTALTRERERKGRVSAEKYRFTIISGIARKLLGESTERAKPLNRTSITLDDIDFSSDRTTAGAYREIRPDETDNLDRLYQVFSDCARPSKEEPETNTCRVGAFLDPRTGHIELLDVYPYGVRDRFGKQVERGIRVYEPTGGTGIKNKPHITLKELLGRGYRPIASILLDDPVKDFHQRFDSLTDFNDAIAEEGANRSKVADWAWAGEPEEGAADISDVLAQMEASEQEAEMEEETPPTMQAGTFQGPGKKTVQALLGYVRGELQRAETVPLTGGEANAVREHVLDFAGREPTAEDFREAMEDIGKRVTQAGTPYAPVGKRRTFTQLMQTLPRYVIRGRDRQVISAFKKAADFIRRKYGETILTPDQAMEQAFDEFYETITQAKDPEEFTQKALGRFTEPVSETRGLITPTVPGAPPGAAPTELSMLARRAPTAVAGMAPGVPPEMTEARPAPPTPPEMLPPGAQAAVEQRAAEEFPVESKPPVGLAKPAGGPALYYPPLEIDPTKGPGKYYKPSSGPRAAAWNKMKSRAEEMLSTTALELGAKFKRKQLEDDLAATVDVRQNVANIQGDQAEHRIRSFANLSKEHPNGDPEILRAAAAVIAVRGRKQFTPGLIKLAENGIVKGENIAQSMVPWKRPIGRAQADAARELKAAAEYALDHWTDPALQNTAKAMMDEMDAQYAREIAVGKRLRYRQNYFPGRYDGMFWNDTNISFPGVGRLSVLGRNWRMPKTFDNMWVAIAADGPYIPAALDGAAIVGHRVRQGMGYINRKLWRENLLEINDPVSGERIARRPRSTPEGMRIPGPNAANYELLTMGPMETLAVRKGYSSLINALTQPSWFQKYQLTRAAVETAMRLKHSLLAGDIFHLFREMYYGVATTGTQVGFRAGRAALEYDDASLQRAVQAGVVSKADADWSRQQVNVRVGNQSFPMTRRQILEQGIARGFNVGRIQDAIYRDLVNTMPVVGKALKVYNRWLFDDWTRGLMSEAYVRNFEVLNKKHPNVDWGVLARDVARDTNTFFGSLGRQGWIKSETFQDLSRLAFLAPQWVESLLRKEIGAYGRLGAYALSKAGLEVGRTKAGLPAFGMLGKGMGRGLAAMFAITQIVNLISRGKPTWQNPEKGHMWDAWVQVGDHGVWISPLSIFNELLHDVLRYSVSKPKVHDAIQQIGQNKLGPYSRAIVVLASSRTPTGQLITTTPRVYGEAAKQLFPVPIGASQVLRAAVHPLVPGLVSAPPPGQVARQAFSTLGVKAEPAQSPQQELYSMAQDFLAKSGMKKETGFQEVPTVEASFTRLRQAIGQNDMAGFEWNLKHLMKNRNVGDVIDGMKRWVDRPITGNRNADDQFLTTLTPEQFKVYSQAREDKWKTYIDFYRMLFKSEGVR